MPTGEITRLARDDEYGFIRPAGAEDDLFFHISGLHNLAFDQLREGQLVEFEINPRGTRAINIRAPR